MIRFKNKRVFAVVFVELLMQSRNQGCRQEEQKMKLQKLKNMKLQFSQSKFEERHLNIDKLIIRFQKIYALKVLKQ